MLQWLNPARTGRMLTDPLGYPDGSKHGRGELVLSLMTGRSTPLTSRVEPANTGRPGFLILYIVVPR